MVTPSLTIRGFKIFKEYLQVQAQEALLRDLREVAESAPPFSPQTPYGKPMSVKLTSAGKYGWYSDRSGYRIEESIRAC